MNLIPIDGAIKDFKNHLLSHPRTILSAKYGDGKTFFLSKFINSPKVKSRFTFLTLYPINYQVLPNKDIFELIKRDLLIQMISIGMLESYEISEEVSFAFYLQNRFSTVSEAILPFLQVLDTSSSVAKGVIAGLSGLKMLTTLKKKYKEWKDEFDSAYKIEDYIIKHKDSIYENDAITEIIRGGIESYKKNNPRKRVVLIIEDLDRIDPAHLFRILNVFSAHMDYGYRLGVPISAKYLVGNKFGLDNVVMVMDYDNTHNIFKHFYGEYANFNGYIDKFCSNNYFRYSLAEQKYNYIIKRVRDTTKLPEVLITPFFSKNDIEIKSIRDISKCFIDIDKDLLTNEKVYKPLNKGLLKLFVILRRFGKKNVDILRILNKIMSDDIDFVMKYASAFLSILNNNGKLGTFGFNIGDRYYTFEYNQIDKDGTMNYSSYFKTRHKQTSLGLASLFDFIVK